MAKVAAIVLTDESVAGVAGMITELAEYRSWSRGQTEERLSVAVGRMS